MHPPPWLGVGGGKNFRKFFAGVACSYCWGETWVNFGEGEKGGSRNFKVKIKAA